MYLQFAFASGEHHVGLSPFLETSDRFKVRRKSDCYGDQRTAAAVAFGSTQVPLQVIGFLKLYEGNLDFPLI